MARKDFKELSELLRSMLDGLEKVRSQGTEFTVKDVFAEIWEDGARSDTERRDIGSHFYHLVAALRDVESTGEKKPLARYQFRK